MQSTIYYADERGYEQARVIAGELGAANAEIKGLKRVVRQLGLVLKQIDPDNEFLSLKKVDEIYKNTKLELPSPFK
jgi:hypothetical protein